jgi:hypothetical protein
VVAVQPLLVRLVVIVKSNARDISTSSSSLAAMNVGRTSGTASSMSR